MIFYRRTYRPSPGRVEVLLGVLLVGVLATLLAWVRTRGRDVDEDLFRLDVSALADAGPGPRIYEREVVEHESRPVDADPVMAMLPERLPGTDFVRTGPVQVYGPERLYEKINGRETLYKSYGFRKLWWAGYESGEETLDIEIFRQESPMAAFGIFSAERAGLEGAGLEPTRTITPNGLYSVVEDYYVRILGSAASETIREATEVATRTLARGLAGEEAGGPPEPGPPPGPPPGPTPASPAAPTRDGAPRRSPHVHGPTCPAGYDEPCPLPTAWPTAAPGAPAPGGTPQAAGELASLMADPSRWTPAANPLVELGAAPSSLEFHSEYGLGVEFFSDLYVASLPVDGESVRIYLMPRDTPEEAAEAFRGYLDVLRSTGAEVELSWPEGAPGERLAVLIDMLDTLEATMLRGRYVAGVTEAEDRVAAEGALDRLSRALSLAP